MGHWNMLRIDKAAITNNHNNNKRMAILYAFVTLDI